MGILQEDIAGDVSAMPVCQRCGSDRVVREAWACWNPATGLWELETVFDREYCHQCEAETRCRWKRAAEVPRAAIRDLNDRFRRKGAGHGSVVITQGVQAKGAAFIDKAITAVRGFDGFNEANDPWAEHDFGVVEVEGDRVFWKIDPYDLSLTMLSQNPANEGVTHRVLTIMLASEY
ncbi:DUF3768 domain-containing protein [Aliiruegeria lutimaris]|uniref:DUF3768 domain-containing protein n=1 Tax=Aliiruegeria lutimaris TaxID=571298 RepID=A0A1G9INB9_9RHOB|nr:DUF3768 domain-containing protein [Aliiruegeria lutimaris]SDL26423.1 Protein of unknown function [Aliiruegeria lutimaris]